MFREIPPGYNGPKERGLDGLCSGGKSLYMGNVSGRVCKRTGTERDYNKKGLVW